MEHEEIAKRHAHILNHLAHLPRKMVSLHGYDQVAAFVLHDLCDENCFNFERAAYFVDNPDFDCLKGVVGCARAEVGSSDDIWSMADQFNQKIAYAPFNKQVTTIILPSMLRKAAAESDTVQELAAQLGLQQCEYCSWPMKHDNHGLLLFEKADAADETPYEHIVNGASLLSFCPVI